MSARRPDAHNSTSAFVEEPPRKRQRLLACRRCRNRKQKCDDSRPCSNCRKSGKDCVATEPAPRVQVETDHVRALEERIAELESHEPRRASAASQGHTVEPNHRVRRLTQSSTHSSTHGRHHNRPRASLGMTDQVHHVADHGPSEAVDALNPHGGMSLSPANTSVSSVRRGHLHTHRSPDGALSLADDSDSDLNHLAMGLVTSPSVNFRQDDGYGSVRSPIFLINNVAPDGEFRPQTDVTSLDPDAEELLLDAYFGRAQAQYPFLHWTTFLSWLSDWKQCPPSELGARSWQGFFVNLVYATAHLLLAIPNGGYSDARQFYRNAMYLLPSVYQQRDDILTMQSYLLLNVHSLHKSSTPRVLFLASLTIRYCVQLQFHLFETEPEPVTPVIRLQNQIRRRCFWSAYCVDRLIMASFDIPPSLSDAMITAKLYANVDDEDLERIAAETPVDAEIEDSPSYTCVSSSLHILQCRRIQSEILSYTLHWAFKERYESSLEWRIRILAELENYKARVKNFTDPQSKGHTSQRWLGMIYHYTLLTLYRPTKENVLGPAGDWAIQASTQACLMFRKSQMDRQIAQAWLGLLVQFQSGVTLLYCCWATPPEYRTENYDSPDVSDALRACSNILAIMADRWPKAECLRDVFELLAREVPLVDRPSRPPTHISDTSIQQIKAKLPRVRALVVHRTILRMIEEMITDDFPRLHGNRPTRSISRRATPAPLRERPVPAPTMGNGDVPTVSMAQGPFELPFTTQQMYDGGGVECGSTNLDELFAFPGIFDVNSFI